jgi:crossover junction endodeoxyribonuclease RuvC
MRILGIDPGLNATGYGIIDVRADQCRHVLHGVVRTRPEEGLAARLLAIRDGVREVARQNDCTAAAVESSFVADNARSALALGHARAAAIIACADAGLPVHEYTPNLVKQTVAGYGHGDKAQIAEMVRLQLNLRAVPTPADASDALAIAITHWAHQRVAAELRG